MPTLSSRMFMKTMDRDRSRVFQPSGIFTSGRETLHPQDAGSTTLPFMMLQMPLSQPMPTSGGYSNFNPTPDFTDCTPSAVAPFAYSATMTIEGHIPAMNLGGDLGVQDVFVLKDRDGGKGAFERSYYALGIGLVRFEGYLAADLVPNPLVSGGALTFNLNGPGFLPGPACTETHHAVIVSSNVPSTMTSGQSYPVSVTVKNTGTRTWTSQFQYQLGAVNGDTTWGATTHVMLDSSDAIGSQLRT